MIRTWWSKTLRNKRSSKQFEKKRNNDKTTSEGGNKENSVFKLTKMAGRTPAFTVAFSAMPASEVSESLFHYSEKRQLQINTATAHRCLILLF